MNMCLGGEEIGGVKPAEQYVPFQLSGDYKFLVLEDHKWSNRTNTIF